MDRKLERPFRTIGSEIGALSFLIPSLESIWASRPASVAHGEPVAHPASKSFRPAGHRASQPLVGIARLPDPIFARSPPLGSRGRHPVWTHSFCTTLEWTFARTRAKPNPVWFYSFKGPNGVRFPRPIFYRQQGFPRPTAGFPRHTAMFPRPIFCRQ